MAPLVAHMSERRATLLIVDDEAEVLEALKRALRHQPYRVLTTTSPTDALKLLAEAQVDVLISDIDMPEMTGIELVARVRERHPEVVRILLTGGASLQSAVRAINVGEVHRYLTKPWDKTELRQVLEEAVQRLEELRRAGAAARAVSLRERIRLELEREHPGITTVTQSDGIYMVNAERVERLAESIEAPALRTFFGK
jgi:two-component system, probable response regulator PhcQ